MIPVHIGIFNDASSILSVQNDFSVCVSMIAYQRRLEAHVAMLEPQKILVCQNTEGQAAKSSTNLLALTTKSHLNLSAEGLQGRM
jgi:hypothetical protein